MEIQGPTVRVRLFFIGITNHFCEGHSCVHVHSYQSFKSPCFILAILVGTVICHYGLLFAFAWFYVVIGHFARLFCKVSLQIFSHFLIGMSVFFLLSGFLCVFWLSVLTHITSF